VTLAGSSFGRQLVGIRLLFIDDEASLRAGVQAFGEMRGFSVLTAADGVEGLDLIRDSPVDAVVCDLRMPGMDGAAFHDRLQREHPGLAARTVFITGDVVTTSGRTGPGSHSSPCSPSRSRSKTRGDSRRSDARRSGGGIGGLVVNR